MIYGRSDAPRGSGPVLPPTVVIEDFDQQRKHLIAPLKHFVLLNLALLSLALFPSSHRTLRSPQVRSDEALVNHIISVLRSDLS